MQVCYVAFWDEITRMTQELQGNRIGENHFIGIWRIVVVRDLPFTDQRLNGKIPKVDYLIWSPHIHFLSFILSLVLACAPFCYARISHIFDYKKVPKKNVRNGENELLFVISINFSLLMFSWSIVWIEADLSAHSSYNFYCLPT